MATANDKIDLLKRIDTAPLSARFWTVYGLVTAQICCEIFDFMIVGFLITAVAGQWHLNFGETTIILMSVGVGAVVGAPLFGWIGDRFGRKSAILLGTILYCFCAGGIAIIPNGAWGLFALLRFFVGVGYGGAGSNQFALMVEYTPTRLRTVLSSALGLPASLGIIASSIIVAGLYPVLGWRGTAALGLAPILVGFALLAVAPESPRWLLANGMGVKARKAVAAITGCSPDNLIEPTFDGEVRARPSFFELFASPRRFFLIVGTQMGLGATLSGVLLWGPGVIGQLLHATPTVAAKAFLFISIAGFIGRLAFTYLPQKIGRVKAGILSGIGGAIFLTLAAVFHTDFIGILPAFPLLVAAGQFFYDGGYSNLNPYGVEVYPVRIAALGGGLASAAGGIGKIVGPLVLGLLAGVNNLVTPHATQDAIFPGFLFLAACSLFCALTFVFLGIETHGKELSAS